MALVGRHLDGDGVVLRPAPPPPPPPHPHALSTTFPSLDWTVSTTAPSGSYSAALLGPSGCPGCVNNTIDFKQALCATLVSFGIDDKYWWIN